jgi:hypothetical protein
MYASEAGLGAAVFDLEHGGTGDLGSAYCEEIKAKRF